MKKLTAIEKHQLAIAKKTLKITDLAVELLGGMTKKEAKEIIKKYSKKTRRNR